LAIWETEDFIGQAVIDWQNMQSDQSADQRGEYLSRVAMVNDRSVVIRPTRGSQSGCVLFVGKLVRKHREVIAQAFLHAALPPRPRAWTCASKDGGVVRLVCLPFEGNDPRIVVLFDD
jgi:hypothetical protein